jgi:hypothetical protein
MFDRHQRQSESNPPEIKFMKEANLFPENGKWQFNTQLHRSFASRATNNRQVNRKPIKLRISKTQIDENSPANSIVGQFKTIDPDRRNTFKYRLIRINGSEDDKAFKIVRNTLTLKTIPDFETQSVYRIKVRTTDQGNLFRDRILNIQINDLAESQLPQKPEFKSPQGSERHVLSNVLRIDQWESNMKVKALGIYGTLTSPISTEDDKLAATYYDGERVFTEIAEYLHDPQFYTYAQAAGKVYQDYVLKYDGNVPGYWNFTDGLTKRYQRTGDPIARKAVQLLATNGAFARDNTPLDSTRSFELSREVANVIQAYLNAEKVGEPRRWRLRDMVDQALGHLDQWFGTKTASYVKSFMVGLTAESLIDYQEQVGDDRIVGALIQAMDGLWERSWDASAEAFKYVDRPHGQETNTGPAPDLNLLIAPVYGWLYRETGAVRFRERGDQIFNGGVKGAWTDNGKHYNQNYQWSIEYIKWRKEGLDRWKN